MKAIVYTQPDAVTVLDRDMPDLEPGEILLRIDASGICGSDLHAYHGHDPRRKPGLVLGHEFAGTVIASSDEARMPAGQRITANPLVTCGHCDYCLQGRDNLCANRGMVGMSRPGALSEYLAIPIRCAIPIPDTLPSVSAALTEPAATALHAVNLTMRAMNRPLPEASVLIIGGGAIGMLTAALVTSYGCKRVCVAETNALRQASVSRHLGCEVIDPIASPPAESAFDVVIDAVGAAPTRKLAIAATRAGGVVMHIGLQAWSSEIDMRKLTLAELTLLGTYTYTMSDMHATVRALELGNFGSLEWVETRSLADGPAAFADLAAGRVAAGKVVLIPELS
ncbi:galactitol-1-phosphate 5-dehydrogenase [Cupriavidus alkaliphilus]|uniref:galactitol-1-phosphate 5-dehydrogenase n=1 Tax=Cupriavidus alkaliphilus TaxID=942866 RepID=UPI000DC27128|nr:galactitol-1-phosphate 5-dehydrogenase [Cupriavidus alkaliphilus]MBB3016216.1 alcohol dehydrogenase [Cupriavidus alkaliphilus]RAR99977.1 alcohol dehydrogenase [Cupriavidus alkaliphilus]